MYRSLFLCSLMLAAAHASAGDSTLDAAIGGQGVMLAWPTLAHYALKAGTLVAPFPERAKSGGGYFLLTSKTRREDARIAGFKRWIEAEIADTVEDFEEWSRQRSRAG